LAAEAVVGYGRFCYGGLQPPPNLRFEDLAILTIWYLRLQAAACITKKLSIRRNQLAVSVTLGIPRGFYESPGLRTKYLRIARAAEWLDKAAVFPSAPMRLAEAQQYVAAAHAQAYPEVEDDRYWIRSEAEADMFWPVRCPAVSPGPYAQIDIGAGTTNAAIVSIWQRNYKQRWIKDSLGFYGVFSVPVGTDANRQSIGRMLAHVPKSMPFSPREGA
jgi:hypothetical protein